MEQSIPSDALTNCVAIATRPNVAMPFLPDMTHINCSFLKPIYGVQPYNRIFRTTENVAQIPSVAKTVIWIWANIIHNKSMLT